MPDFVAPLNRSYHRLVDLFLRVNPSSALNRDRQPHPSGPGIAQQLFVAVQTMKAEAYDPACNCFDYTRLTGSETYSQFRGCTARLLQFDPSALDSRQERLAFWINLHNALIIDAVIAFQPERIDDQLDLACSAYVNGGARVEEGDRLCLSPIFRWYRRDFGRRQGVREFVLRYLDDGQGRALLEDDQHGQRLGFYRYNWSLNQI